MTMTSSGRNAPDGAVDPASGLVPAASAELHGAVRAHDLKRVQALLAEGAAPALPDRLGTRPMEALVMYAGHTDDIAIAEELIAAGGAADVVGDALADAIHGGRWHLIDVLLGAGLTLEARQWALLAALGKGRLDLIPRLATPESIEGPCHLGAPIMHFARTRQDVDVLLDAGAEVDATDRRGRTALHQCGSARLATALLRRGASVNARDARGRTPIHYAGSEPIVRKLLKAGADLDSRDEQGATPLMGAIEQNRGDVAINLIHRGADLDCADCLGRTALMLAAWHGSPTVFEALLGAGVDPRRGRAGRRATAVVLARKESEVRREGIRSVLQHAPHYLRELAWSLRHAGPWRDLAWAIDQLEYRDGHLNNELIAVLLCVPDPFVRRATVGLLGR